MKQPKAGELSIEPMPGYMRPTWGVQLGWETIGTITEERPGEFIAGRCRTADPTLEAAVARLLRCEVSASKARVKRLGATLERLKAAAGDRSSS